MLTFFSSYDQTILNVFNFLTKKVNEKTYLPLIVIKLNINSNWNKKNEHIMHTGINKIESLQLRVFSKNKHNDVTNIKLSTESVWVIAGLLWELTLLAEIGEIN